MAIGDVIRNRFDTYVDEFTGASVTRLTDAAHTSHHMYFYAHMTTKDGSRLLYSPELGGERQVWCMDLASGEAVQLTEGEGLDDWSAEFTGDERGVLYQQAGSVWLLDLESLTRDEVYRAPAGWTMHGLEISRDALAFTTVEMRTDTVAAPIGVGGWDFLRENCLAKPLCRIVRVDVASGAREVLLEQRCWLDHAVMRPGDSDEVMYCHQGPYDMVDAHLWLMDGNGARVRCARQQPNDVIVSHQFWEPDGRHLAFVYRDMGLERDRGTVCEEIHEIDPDTLEERVVARCRPLAHCICNQSGCLFVGDAQGDPTPLHLQREGDIRARQAAGAVLDDFVYLIDRASGREVRLAYHGSSWSSRWGTTQDAHPHPCFTEDGNHVLFVTDRFGHPSICMVDLQAFVEGHPELRQAA